MYTKLRGTFLEEVPRTYIPSLHALNKWRKIYPGIEVGDIVLINDPGTPRGLWPMGRVEQVFPSPEDGRVRNCRVIVRGKSYERPVQKLAVLQRGPGEAREEKEHRQQGPGFEAHGVGSAPSAGKARAHSLRRAATTAGSRPR